MGPTSLNQPANNSCSTGTTGYIGGDALYALNKKFPDFEYTALVRNSDSGAKVDAEYPKMRLVYGTLEDSDLLEAESARADIVLRTYSPYSQLLFCGGDSKLTMLLYRHGRCK